MRSDANLRLQATQRRKAARKGRRAIKRGLKQPPRGLAEWVRLANLIPPGAVIQGPGKPRDTEDYWPAVLEWVAGLDDPLRTELLSVSARSSVDDFPHLTQARPGFLRAAYIVQHFEKIRIAYTCLRVLSKPNSEPAMDYLEDFLNTMRYVELPYLRQCGVCNKIFYAKRKTQSGCTTNHSTILYKREQYAKKRDKAARDKANRAYKKRTGEK